MEERLPEEREAAAALEGSDLEAASVELRFLFSNSLMLFPLLVGNSSQV